MWPLESRHDVLRVGACRVERWVVSPAGLVLAGSEAAGAASGHRGADLQALGQALSALLAAGCSRRAHLVIESAWLPMLLLETGALWSRAELHALLRHRLGHLFDAPGQPGVAWELMLDHRAGDAHGLGYGLAPAVKDVLVKAGTDSGVRWASMQPAFAWGWQRLKRERAAMPGAGWWLWKEQDRTLVGQIVGKRVRAMNTAAAPIDDPARGRRIVEIERVRFGVEGDASRGVIAGWDTELPASAGSGLAWVSVAAPASVPARALTTRMASPVQVPAAI